MTTEITHYILEQFNSQRNTKNAAAMASYLKTNRPFFGINSPKRRLVLKDVRQQFEISSQSAYENQIRELWALPERECHYMALDIAVYYKNFRTLESWPLYEELIYSAYWWDNLDVIAPKLVGELWLDNRESLTPIIQSWADHSSIWVRRASLLSHLKHKSRTDTVLLGETIDKLCQDKEFFIRKAIGWILREYGKHNADWVLQFVEKRSQQLSTLSKKEALRIILK